MYKYVRQTPLSKLWTDREWVKAQRGRNLTISDIKDILQVGPVRFVVANVGAPLEWIPLDECFRFWKSAKPNIANLEDDVYLEDYPFGFVYSATEWLEESGERIILLEVYH